MDMELGLDPTLPHVELILGGKTYHLCFDFNAIVRAEKETGLNLLRAALEAVNATNIRGLLWASLLHENPTLTIEHVGSFINYRNIAIINDAVRTAWFGSIPEPEEGAEGEAKAQTEQV